MRHAPAPRSTPEALHQVDLCPEHPLDGLRVQPAPPWRRTRGRSAPACWATARCAGAHRTALLSPARCCLDLHLHPAECCKLPAPRVIPWQHRAREARPPVRLQPRPRAAQPSGAQPSAPAQRLMRALRLLQLQLARCLADGQCLEDLVCLNLCNNRKDEQACQACPGARVCLRSRSTPVAAPAHDPACIAVLWRRCVSCGCTTSHWGPTGRAGAEPVSCGAQIKCGDKYMDKAINTFNECAVSDKKCVPQRVETDFQEPQGDQLAHDFDLNKFQVLRPCCPGARRSPAGALAARWHSARALNAQQLSCRGHAAGARPASHRVSRPARPSTRCASSPATHRVLVMPLACVQGRWYITAGLNPLFDTFDCQEHYFGVPEEGVCSASRCTGRAGCRGAAAQLSWCVLPGLDLHPRAFSPSPAPHLTGRTAVRCVAELPADRLRTCRPAAGEDQLAHPQGQERLHRAQHHPEVQAGGARLSGSCHPGCRKGRLQHGLLHSRAASS